MDINNITTLAAQLQQLGFDSMGNILVKRICFKQNSFSIEKLMGKGEDKLYVELFFEKKDDIYILKCYDIAIQQKPLLQLQEIDGIDITSLEDKMAVIDWKQAFNLSEEKIWNAKEDFTNEENIEAVITTLTKLESSEDGKAIAIALKNKYWNGTNFHEIFGVIATPKFKAEISQRFFFFDGQPGISFDEAYRFIQNRRMEKQMKKKQVENSDTDSHTENDTTGSGNGLLKKKRISPTVKKNKHKIVN